MNETIKQLCQYVEELHKANFIEYDQYISLYDLIANVTVEFEKLERERDAARRTLAEAATKNFNDLENEYKRVAKYISNKMIDTN